MSTIGKNPPPIPPPVYSQLSLRRIKYSTACIIAVAAFLLGFGASKVTAILEGDASERTPRMAVAKDSDLETLLMPMDIGARLGHAPSKESDLWFRQLLGWQRAQGYVLDGLMMAETADGVVDELESLAIDECNVIMGRLHDRALRKMKQAIDGEVEAYRRNHRKSSE